MSILKQVYIPLSILLSFALGVTINESFVVPDIMNGLHEYACTRFLANKISKPVDPRLCGKLYVVCDGKLGQYCNPQNIGCDRDREVYRGNN